MNQFEKLETAFNKFIQGLWSLCGIFLFFITFSVIVDVILRSTTRFSLSWIVEINEYMLFLITFLGAAWCLKTEGHVKIDYIFDRLRPKIQVILNLVVSLVGGISCLIFAYYAWIATLLSIQRKTHLLKFLKVPKYYFTSIMFISTICLFILFLIKGCHQFKIWRAQPLRRMEGSK
jgi:TRAP-type C4-dicarboxylate transport system permease small subunit